MPQEHCRYCLMEITERAIKLSTRDPTLQRKLLQELSEFINAHFAKLKLPDISTKIFRIIAKETGTKDPFLAIKKESNLYFLQIVPMIRKWLQDLDQQQCLNHLMLYSIAANMVDFSTGGHTVNLSSMTNILEEFPQEGLTINDFDELYTNIQNAQQIIYLSDNCGEVVVDNLVIEFLTSNLNKKVFLGLKGAPVANDCTLQDFTRDQLPPYATEIFPVSSSFGWNLHESTDYFKKLLVNADLLIVKGQSNYETTLNNLVRHPNYSFPPIFCILRTKCKVISDHLGAPLGSNIIKQMFPLTRKEKDSLTEIVDY
ncbi:MAG: DUF89 family protein [Candidatus Heimdallarchaeota archaeon]|nr:DUF89 family protein [Candidatus Heimdallarchaeota archaeon]